MLVKRLVLTLFCLLLSAPLYGFDTLSEAIEYARTVPEFPSIENPNVLQPSFAQLQKRMASSLFSCFLERIGLRKPLWSTGRACAILAPLVASMNATPRVTLAATPAEQFLVVGPLYGSFHALVRILQNYKKQGFLDEELRISKLHTFMVFDGALFLGSPYGLEVTTLIGALMRKNPKTVIFLASTDNMARVDLKLQLERRGCYSAQCEEIITEFFTKSPSTLVISQEAKKEDEIIISASDSLPDFQAREPRSAAFIIPESRLMDYAIHKGCLLQIPVRGMALWSVFSAPNTLYKDYFHFYYDAYTLVKIGATLRESTITLYNRDIRTKADFAPSFQASLFTGISLGAQGFSFKKIAKNEMITFSSTMDLSSAHRYIGFDIEVGIAAALQRVNEKGGINGKFVDFVVEDDQYSPEKSRLNIEKALATRGPLIVSPVGSETVAASIDLIKEKKIYVLFTNSGSSLFRDPSLTNMINFRASYKQEGRALVAYAHKNLIGRKFAFLVQDDGHGLSALSGAKEMLKELGIKEWTEGLYEHNTVDVAAAAERIKKANPDVIGFFSVAPATIEFIKRVGEEFLINKKLLAMSPLGEKSFRSLLSSYGLSATFAQVVPDPRTSTLQIAQDYRRDIASYGVAPDTYSFEGYIYGRLSAELFKKVEGPLTPAALSKVIENLKNYQFKGLTLTYDPSLRQISNDLWLELPSHEWLKQTV